MQGIDMPRARQGYAELETTMRTLFIPFDEARSQFYALIDTLEIPLE
jgi:hypothetical protein